MPAPTSAGGSWPNLPSPEPSSSPCPSGQTIAAGLGESASGFRAQTLILTNCGSDSYPLNGYPEIQFLSAAGEPVDAEVLTEGPGPLDGSGVPLDPGPSEILLMPQQTAYTILTWTSRVTSVDGSAVTAEKIGISAASGQTPFVLDLVVDIGDTREARVTAWQAGVPG